MSKAADLLEEAKKLAAQAGPWADLSNALFDPLDGIVAKAYPTREERAAFIQSKEYDEIRALIDAAIARTGLVEGATPSRRPPSCR